MAGLTTVVKTPDIPAIVLDRIADHSPQHALFDSDEVLAWPPWVLKALLTAGLLRETSRATEVFCDGCEWGCLKPIVVRTLPNARKPRAFVVCDEEPNLGRIEIGPDRLKRYTATVGLAARFVSRSLGLKSTPEAGSGGSVCVGRLQGRSGGRVLAIEPRQGQLLLTAGGHGVVLSDLVFWDRRALALEHRAIRRLINRRAAKSSLRDHPPPEHAKQGRRKKASRDEQISLEAVRLRRQNRKWTITQVANHISKMELADGISAARVRRIIYENR
jgi:hypothetical protein